MPTNRSYKDSVFSCYFSEKPERLIELYNAIEGTDYPLDTKIELNTLDDVLYKNRINDISFLLDGRLVVLIEHQSTINRNMALRMLLYLGRLYEKILTVDTMYRQKLVKLPTPKFIVLYNGTEDCPEHSQQFLSSAFQIQESEPALELMVDVWNVNYGKNQEVIQKCRSLGDYSYFVYSVREGQRNGLGFEEAVATAIHECVRNDIMREFLNRHGSKVENMLFGEWDWELAKKINLEEAFEDGMEKGEAKGRAEGIFKTLCSLVTAGLLTLSDAIQQAGIPQSEFMDWMKQFYPDYQA